MPRIRLERLVQYKPSHVFSVVSDVDRYKQFLPYCISSSIVKTISPHLMEADLTIGFDSSLAPSNTYRSRVELDPFSKISIRSIDSSLFSSLNSNWDFQSHSEEEKCSVSFEIDCELRSSLYATFFEQSIHTIATTQLNAFEKRCALLKDSQASRQDNSGFTDQDLVILRPLLEADTIVEMSQGIVDSSLALIKGPFYIFSRDSNLAGDSFKLLESRVGHSSLVDWVRYWGKLTLKQQMKHLIYLDSRSQISVPKVQLVGRVSRFLLLLSAIQPELGGFLIKESEIILSRCLAGEDRVFIDEYYRLWKLSLA